MFDRGATGTASANGHPADKETAVQATAGGMPGGQPRQDFWTVYEERYDEVMNRLRREVAQDPDFAPVVALLDAPDAAARDAAARERLRRAMVDDEWDAYWEHLREQGAGYALAGLTFSAWFKLVAAFRNLIRPTLIQTYGDDLDRLNGVLDVMNALIDNSLSVIGQAYLDTKEDVIGRQEDAIEELSTPVLQLREGLLILPIVGAIDPRRARRFTEQLLRSIRDTRAKVVVIDITGVPDVDSRVANHLVQTVDASRLMGASVIVTGLSPEVAQTLVTIGVDLAKLRTVGDLQGGVDEADRLAGYRVLKLDRDGNPIGIVAGR